jgi:preprotein translocase subunit SecE
MNTYLTDGSWPGLMAAVGRADYVTIGIWAGVIGVVFAILWFTGNLVKLRNYVLETREELRKCTWPTWEELRGSTVLVMISIFLLGVFTVIIDQILFVFVNWMVKI